MACEKGYGEDNVAKCLCKFCNAALKRQLTEAFERTQKLEYSLRAALAELKRINETETKVTK